MRSKRRTREKACPEGQAGQARGTGSVRKPTGRGRDYLPFPQALEQLAGRLGATADEIAAWVFLGPDCGGLCAYLNANEMDPPPRFYFGQLDPDDGFDYLAPLMKCWFDAEEVRSFAPTERFMTGRALIERWGKRPGIQAEAFIVAKVEESRLCDLHPIFGGTRATDPHDAELPPLEAGLFCLADVEAIEATDFCDGADRGEQRSGATRAPASLKQWMSERGRIAANARHDQPGGSRDKADRMRQIWASGKYTSKDRCAEEECGALGMSFSAARRALRNEPDPKRT